MGQTFPGSHCVNMQLYWHAKVSFIYHIITKTNSHLSKHIFDNDKSELHVTVTHIMTKIVLLIYWF